MTDIALQRTNMVESQVRPSDITDRRIIRAMGRLPREQFVLAGAEAVAYMDLDVQASDGKPPRRLLAPRTLAKLVQLADVDAKDRVLDVGCVSGYSTALLAELAGEVIGLEVDPALAKLAGERLAALKLANASIATGPLAEGFAPKAPFDAIVLQGCVPEAPVALLGQLKPGGRLVAILAASNFGKAVIWRHSGASTGSCEMFDAGGPQLPGFERKAIFVF